MFRTSLKAFRLAAGLALLGVPAAAQMHQDESMEDRCTFCAPYVYLDGAALWRTSQQLPSFTADETTPLVRARLEVGSFVPRVGIFSTMEFTPADGPSPTITAGLQVWALPRGGDFNVTGGLGVIDARQGVGESSPGAYVARGWGQVGAQYHTPVHELSLYAQAGAAFSGSKRVTYQLGLSHPIAPYTFHPGF